LTATGRAALVEQMSNIREFQPVASIVWAIAASTGRLLPDGNEKFEFFGPHWSLGYHDRAKLPSEDIFEIDGIPYFFDQPRATAGSVSVTIDHSNGRFIVTDGAA
jgi:hypothetical protein